MEPITVAGSHNPVSPAADTTFPIWFYITFPDDVGSCAAMLVLSTPRTALIGPAGDAIPFAFDDLARAIGTTSSQYQVYSFGGGKQFSDTLRITPPQDISAGVHSQAITLSLYENGALIARGTMTIAVNVLSACTLPAPDVTTLDFSPGISQGRVASLFTQTAVIHGAACTGPARLTLRGAPMATDAPPTQAFDSHLDYTARASLASTAVSFSTANAAQSSVAIPSASSPLTIDVSLTPGSRPLAAGRYTSTLRVTLEPAN
jgi:hypothetical protein